MLREIVEGLQGRKRIINDTLSLQGIIKLLLSQNPNVRGTVYFNGTTEYIVTNANPEMMIQQVQEHFGMSGGGEYITITHKAFKGRSDEKNHIDLKMGMKYSTYTEVLHHGKQMHYEAPFRKMTIDFLVTE
jgi:hypothetical protein